MKREWSGVEWRGSGREGEDGKTWKGKGNESEMKRVERGTKRVWEKDGNEKEKGYRLSKRKRRIEGRTKMMIGDFCVIF